MSNKNQSDIQLRIIAAIDGLVDISKLITEVDKLGGQTTESSVEVEKLVSDLDKLRQQDQLIGKFQQLKAVTVELESTLDNARTRATALGKGLADSKAAVAATNSEYKASMSVTQQLSNEWVQAKAKVDLLSTGIKNTAAPTREQRDELKKAREEAKALGEQYRASSKETTTLASALRSTESAVTKQTKEFNSARKEVNQLDAQYQKQNGTLNSLRTTLQQTGVNTKQLVAEQQTLKSATVQAEIGVKGLSEKLREQSSLHKYLKENVDLSGSAFKQNAVESKKLAASHAEASVSSNGFASTVSGLTSRLLAMAGAYVGITTITSAIKEMFNQGNQAELLQIQMNAVMGSIQAGEQATAWIQKFAKETPLQLNEVTQAFTTMKSFGLDPMDGSLQMVVDQSFKLGKGFEGVQRISLALGQAWAKQKLQGEEIMQLVEAGVPVWDLLAKATGKNTYELQRLSEQGNLGRKVIKQLMDEIGNGAAGAAAANMGTLSGLISNAKDNLDTFYRTVADSGAMDWLKTQLSNLNAEFDKMSKDGRLTKYAKQVSDYLVTTAEGVKGFVLNIGGTFDGLINATNVTFQSLRIVFNTFTLAIKSAVTIAMVPLVGFAKMLDGMAYAAEAIGLDSLASKLKFASGAIKAEFDAFAAAAKEDMNDIADASSKLSVDHKDATDAMKESMQGVSDKSDTTSKNIVKNNKQVAESSEDTAKKIKDAFSDGGLDLEQASGRIGSTVKGYVDGLHQIANSADVNGDAINQFLSKAFDSTKNKSELDALISEMDVLHNQGRITGDVYISSLGAAANAAKNLSSTNVEAGKVYIDLLKKQKTELDVFTSKIEEAHNQGVLTGDAYLNKLGTAANAAKNLSSTNVEAGKVYIDLLKKQKAAFDESYSTTHLESYKNKSNEIAEDIKKAEQEKQIAVETTNKSIEKQKAVAIDSETALASMGITSAAALKKAADEAEANFNVVSSGKHTIEELKASFMVYAQASLAASKATGELPNPLLESKAAALGLSSELDKLKKSLSSSGSAAETASKQYDVFAWDTKRVATGSADVVKSYSVMTPMFKAATIDMSKAASYMSMSIADLNKEIETQNAQIGKLRYQVGVMPDEFGSWTGAINKASIEVYKFYANAARAAKEVQGLQTALAENPSETLINRAEHALSKYKELGSQNLSGLKSAIDAAKAKMDSLNASVQSTLNSLRDQADELNNNNAAIENRRYQTQVAELEAKLAEAKAMQDKQAIDDMKEVLRLAQEIHNQKLATIKAEQAASKQSSASSSNSSSTSSSADPSSGVITKTVTVNLKTGSTITPVQVTDESQADALLSALEKVGLRTA